MEGSGLPPDHGKKRTRDHDDDAELGFFASRKRTDHGQAQPRSDLNASLAESGLVQTTWGPVLPIGATSLPEEAVAKFGVYRNLEPSGAHNSSDDDSDDGRPFGGRTSTHWQAIKAHYQSNTHTQPHTLHPSDSDSVRKNHIQMYAPPQTRIRTLPVFKYIGDRRVARSSASTLVHQSFQELQSARLNTGMGSGETTTDNANMSGRGGPHQMADFPYRRSQAPSPSPTLEVDALNSAPPAQQKQMLGEVLYHKIRKQQPELAPKITGMLLEMDNTYILDLIADDVALYNKIVEATRVYKDYLKSEQKQKEMLGELLYPRIREQQPELAGTITGMLLEMDTAELLDLTTNDAALRSKVAEAIAIYNKYLEIQGSEGATHAHNNYVNEFISLPASYEPPPLNEPSPPGPHVSTLPVVDYSRIVTVFQPGSSTPIVRPHQGLQLGESLEQVEMCPRIDNMDVEGGKLYLAQTLHFHYRLWIGCPLHETEEGKVGHARHVSGKKSDAKPQSRMWRCALQSDHHITNTEYIELAKAQLPHKIFANVAEELIRQLRSKQCQPRRPKDPAQFDDFDFHSIVPYVVVQ
ncbi:Polyadenylate-binding protein/Hyperplastic disc protein [Aureobasidium pullulans]|uniref:Polyadenylate-binding protein/Hyperplastic disc protein n=1 Tax=Aureobasidium pullulans TaxID=5580 RepID=A0A4S8X2K5_AURPU|nr:Polyadenylate-binding protein/Hyperplastic disc protein [Aureobasidium pullulans]